MQILHDRCCGLDILKRKISACLLTLGPGRTRRKETRSFGTTTPDLLELSDWLESSGCTHVAMESTGSYWKPVFNLLENSFEIIVANPQHIKALPGRKTDVADAEWIADLLQHGLIRASFIPGKPLRELREIVRYRKSLIQERSAEVNRIQKVLEGANIKLASVATDIMGLSGRAMLSALLTGVTDVHELAELAKGKMRKKIPELRKALDGRWDVHQSFVLTEALAHVDSLDETIERCSQEIEQRMHQSADQIALLCSIPGVGKKTAECILSEVGCDMNRFPTHKHLASWAGLCPGNHESAGKHKSGKIRKGSIWLRSSLVESARAAARSRKTYLSALYHRIAARRGANEAAVAVAHAILVIAYHILKNNTPYQELGPNYFDELNRDRVTKRLVKRLESLGHEVTIQQRTEALD